MKEKEGLKKKNKIRTFLKVSAWSAGALIFLLISFGFLLQTQFAGKLILARAAKILEKRAGLSLKAEGLSLNIFKLKAKIINLEVEFSEKNPLPVKAFSCQKISVQTSFSTLMGRAIHLKGVEIIRPAISLKQEIKRSEENQKKEKPGELANSKLEQKLNFRIDSLRLRNGSIAFEESETPISVYISDLKVDVHFHSEENLHLAEVRTGKGSVEIAEGQIDLNGLELSAAFNPEKIKIERFLLGTAHSWLTAAGTVDNYLEKPEIALQAAGKINLEEITRLVKIPGQNSGDISFEIKAAGQVSLPEISGIISGENLTVDGINPVDFRIKINQEESRKYLAQARMKIAQGEVNLQGQFPADFKGPFKSWLNLDKVDLGLISSIFPDWPVRLNVGASGRMEIEGQNFSITKAKAKAEIKLRPWKTYMANSPRPVIAISSDIKAIYSGGRAEIEHFQLLIYQTELNLKGKIEGKEKISGQLTFRVPDLSATRNELVAANLEKSLPELASFLEEIRELKGRMSLEGEISGTINRPVFSLNFNGQDFSFRQTNIRSVELLAGGNLREIDLKRFQAVFDHGRIGGSGKFLRINGSQGFFYNLDTRLEFSEIDLKQFSGFLPEGNRDYLNGLFSGSARLGGTPASPEAEFNLVLSQAEIGSFGIDSLELGGDFKRGKLRAEKLKLIQAESQLTGSFLFDLNSGDLKAELSGQAIKASSFKSWLPGIQAGQADFNLKTSGLWKKPVLNLTLTGQGFLINRIWLPYFELTASSDGEKASARFEVPRFNLSLEAGLELNSPYWLRGQILVNDLPLSSLTGLLPEVEEVPPQVALEATTDFSLPLEKPEELQVEFNFENFDFEGLAALFPALKPANPGGRADGRIKLTGFSSDLSKVQLVAEIPHLNLRLNDIEIKNEAPLSLIIKNRELEVKSFTLLAGKSWLTLSGKSFVKDISNPELDFSLRGELELSDFNPWLTAMTAGGRINLNASLKGDLEGPLVKGTGSGQDVFFRLQDLPIVVSNINGLINVDNSRLKINGLKGLANSGNFSGSGEAVFAQAFSLQSARIDFNLRDFDFNYPPGLTSLSEARLTLTKEKRGWLLSGDFSLLSVNYRQDFYPSTQGLKLAFTRASPVGVEIPTFLYDLGLDINVRTVENIVIKNNLADLELKANLNVKGTIPAPILSGRVENAYPGEIIVGERQYSIERLKVDFLGRETLEPNMDIALNTSVVDQAEDVEVNLNLSGPPSDLKFSLTSNPVRSQEDLASLLLTGKSLKEVQGSALNTISSQLVQHFSSPLASPVTKTLKKWLKAEDIILEPLNIATLQDPGARLTVRKRMAKEVVVTYSIDLRNSQYQTWILDYNLKRNFSLRGFRQDDGVVGLNLRHRFSVGKKQLSAALSIEAGAGRKLSQIEIRGETVFPVEQIEKKLKLKAGKDFKNSEVQKGLNRLYSWYRKKGYVNARIETEIKEISDNLISLTVMVQANQPVEFRFTGDRLLARVRKKALNSWVSRLPEEANLNQFQYVLLLELNRRGYYRAEVKVKKITEKDRISYLAEIKKNGKWKIASFRLEDKPVFKESLLRRVISDYFGAKAKGLWNLVYDQKIALELIQYFYQENGYLGARIEKPVIEEDPGRKMLNLRLKIEAGPQSHVQVLEFQGNSSLSTEELKALLSLKPGAIFSRPALNEDRTALINRYRSGGFKDVKIEAEAKQVEDSSDYSVFFRIDEGESYKISGVDIAGARRTRQSFILKETGLKPGEPVSLERLAQAQKNLYDSGVFQAVNLSSIPEQPENHQEKVLINVQEVPWLTLAYGLQYNTDTRFEGFTQFDFNNLFGRGWNSLLYLRANQRQQDARFSLKVPYIFSRKTESLLSFYYLKDIRDLYITEQFGTSFQQKIMMVKGFDLSWVYKLSRTHDYEKEPSWPFPYDVKVLTSEISVLLNRDTRDDKFDPHRGSLLVSSLSYSPRFLGSDLNYVSSFTQFTMYQAVFPGVIWASCYRLGLASAFGEELIPSKRFYAGGGTSIRGFKLDRVGPVDPWLGLPEGGEAMVVVNQELRFPIYKIFHGVAFFDFGNVYSKLRGIDLTDLRTGAGWGLRISSPLGLIRVDYGFNLKPRPGEPRSTIFFSIGQAF
jgi:outer membrane protein assembly complex protein YaeT